MTAQALISEIKTLPKECLGEVSNFIAFLRYRTQAPSGKIVYTTPIKKNIRKQTVSFGMWKDKEEIGDAGEYVRNLRKARKF